MSLVIREAVIEDRKALGGLVRDLLQHLGQLHAELYPSPAGADEDGDPSDFPTQADLDRAFDLAFGPNPVCKVLIAEQDGKPVGYLSWHWGVWEIYRSLFVIGVFTAPTVRGLGVGRALMNEAKRIALHAEAERIVWMVISNNRPAIDFYKNLGCELIEHDRQMVWDIT